MRWTERLAYVLDMIKRFASWARGVLGRLWTSAVAVYSSPLTWLAVGAVFVVGYGLGFGHGVHGKRELRQRSVAAIATRDIMTKRLAEITAERNALVDQIKVLRESLDHPVASPAKPDQPRRRRALSSGAG